MKKILFSLFACVCVLLAVAMVLPAVPVSAQTQGSALVGASLYIDDQVDIVFCFDPDVIAAKKAEGKTFSFTFSYNNKTYTEADLVSQKDAVSGQVYQTITVGPFKATERNTVFTYSGSMNETGSFSLVSLAKSGVNYYASLANTADNQRVVKMLKSFVNYAVAIDNKANGKSQALPYEVSYTAPSFTADDGSGTPLNPSRTLTGRSFILSDDVYVRYTGSLSSTSENTSAWKITVNSADITSSCNLTKSGNTFHFTVPVHADQGQDKLRIIIRDGSGNVLYDVIDRADALAIQTGTDFADYKELSGALTQYLQAVSDYNNNPAIDANRTYEEGKFYAGFGRVDITPYCDSTELNTSGVLSTEFLDPIYATCVAMRDAEGELTLTYSIDFRNVQSGRNDHYNKMKSSVISALAASGITIDADHIFFNASHNHSAPSVSSTAASVTAWLNNYFFPRLPLAAKKAVQDLAMVEEAYTGTAITGEGTNYNRRYTRNAGSTTIRDYEDNQNGDKGRDRELLTIRFDREGAKDILLVNWQAHAANAAGVADKGSSDFVGALRSTVEKDLDVHFLYVNGASGDLNMTNHPNLDTNEKNFRTSDGIDYVGVGNSIAGTVKALVYSSGEKETALGDMKVTPVYSGTLDLQYRKHLSDGKYCIDADCKECAGKYWAITYNATYSPNGASAYNKKGEYTDPDTGIIYQYYRTGSTSLTNITEDKIVVSGGKTYYRYAGYANSTQYAAAKDEVSIYSFQYQATELTLYTVTIGDKIGFAFAPYEMFNRNGKNIKAGAKEVAGSDATIFIGGYTNGYASYMPTQAAFTKVAEGKGGADGDDGTFETYTCKYAPGTAEYLEGLLTNGLKASFSK